MDTVFYKGKKYSGIRMPKSSQIKLYSAEKHYRGRYITTVNESELDNHEGKDQEVAEKAHNQN